MLQMMDQTDYSAHHLTIRTKTEIDKSCLTYKRQHLFTF